MNRKCYILKFTAITIVLNCILASCSILYAYSIVLATPYDGKVVIRNEKNVVSYLEDIVQNYGDYSLHAYNRKAISYKVKMTSGTTHSFYVINTVDNTYHTLSFSATGKGAVSKGAWAMDTDSDIASYTDYLNGNNRWEVGEIITRNGINTLLTVWNILLKIKNNDTYFFNSKINRNDHHDNCNTALRETLIENK